jgi:hypothetical protein
MKTQIVVHLLPREIDWFEWQIKQLKLSSYSVYPNHQILIDATLNFNLTDWDNSKIPREFFEQKFNNISKLCDWCDTDFSIATDGSILGCNDKRREAIAKSDSDNILYLDCDLIFNTNLLSRSLVSAEILTNQEFDYIISPEIVKPWDHYWDHLVNSQYINEQEPSHEKYWNTDPFKVSFHNNETISLRPTTKILFGGGWFNTISTSLLKKIGIPEAFKGYGVDDTYIALASNILKSKGYKVDQFKLEGMIVVENNRYRHNPYDDFIVQINRQEEFKLASENALRPELMKFTRKIYAN